MYRTIERGFCTKDFPHIINGNSYIQLPLFPDIEGFFVIKFKDRLSGASEEFVLETKSNQGDDNRSVSQLSDSINLITVQG